MSCDIKLNLINKINSFNNVIREVTIYEAVCDRCGRKTGRYSSMEKLNANGDFWAWVEIERKLYCPDCYEYEEKTKEYKPKVKED